MSGCNEVEVALLPFNHDVCGKQDSKDINLGEIVFLSLEVGKVGNEEREADRSILAAMCAKTTNGPPSTSTEGGAGIIHIKVVIFTRTKPLHALVYGTGLPLMRKPPNAEFLARWVPLSDHSCTPFSTGLDRVVTGGRLTITGVKDHDVAFS